MENETDNSKKPVDRRSFLTGAAAAAGVAGLAASKPPVLLAQNAALKPEAHAAVEVTSNVKPGSDFMVDVIKSLGIEYYRRQSRLQLPRPARIHHQLRRQQEPGVAHLLPRRIVGRDGARLRQDRRQADDDHGARHRRACSTRRWRSTTPIATACRSTSCSATFWTSNYRRGDAEWVHSVQDAAAMVRDYTKWDDTPVSLAHFAESAVRAYKIAMTPPY